MVKVVLPNGKLEALSPEQSAFFEEGKVRFTPFSGLLLLYEGEELEKVKKDLAEGTSVEKYRQGKLGEVNQEHFGAAHKIPAKTLEEGQTETA